MKRIATLLFYPVFLFFTGTSILFTSFAAPISAASGDLFSSAGDMVKVQQQYLEMKGNVRCSKVNEKDEGGAIDSALVTIISGGIPYSELWTNKKGKCVFKLPLDKVFMIQVTKQGFVSKFFEVNTKVPADKKGTFGFSFDIDIFEEVKNLDVSVLQKPIAKVSYNIIMEQFAYDVNYTSRINFELKKMYKNYYLLQQIEADSTLHRPATAPAMKNKKAVGN